MDPLAPEDPPKFSRLLKASTDPDGVVEEALVGALVGVIDLLF